MEGGCLGYPGVSPVASQPLDRILLPWLANPHNPAMSPYSRHPSTLNESVEGKKEGGWGGGRWTTIARNPCKSPAQKKQLLKETPNMLRLRNQQHELLEDTAATWNTITNLLKGSWNKPCEPALELATADQEKCLLSSWRSTLLNII